MRITGQENIAAMFGVTVKTIVEWQDQGMPVVRGEFGAGGTAPNEYESSDCIDWLVERETGKIRGESPSDRLKRLQGDALEREAAVARGELIPASQVEPKMLAAVVSAREQFRNEPSRLSRMVGGKTPDEVEALIQQAFEGFLQRLSSWRQARIEEEDEDEGAES